MNRDLNRDQATRDKIIWGRIPASPECFIWSRGRVLTEKEYYGGCCSFDGLTFQQLEELIKGNFIDLNERQNNSPKVAEFRTFLKKHPDMVAHGYAVSLKREDYRVTIEGVEFAGKQAASKQLMEDFEELCHSDKHGSGPDNMNIERLYCWWD